MSALVNKFVYAIATLDTKGEELSYVADCLRRAGVAVRTVDVGTNGPPVVSADVARETVAACGDGDRVLGQRDRGESVTAMSAALVKYLANEHAAGRVAGVIGLGGGGGTALICPALRALPIGLPKLMVSTMASGNTQPYVGSSDITMMYSVVDVAGLNSVSRRVLANAAHAVAGMVRDDAPTFASQRTIGMTMFGVTTLCVDSLRKKLEARGYECLVFHATGSGDRAMEHLVRSGLIHGVIDVTTTAVADEVVGGVLNCGPDRFDAILQAKIPYVLSVGALDMVNFGARDTVPARFADRRFHIHNAQVTLMRTTPNECRQIARWITAKLNRATSPVTILLPEQGVSALDAVGQPFFEPMTDAALFEEIEATLQRDDLRTCRRLPLHINDPQFAEQLAETYLALATL